MDKNNELFDLDTITSGIKPLSEKGVMDKDNDIGSGMFTFSSDNTLSYIESRIMPVKVESNLSDEDIDKVVDRLMKKVRVILDEINITANEGVLRGCANISLYLGRKHPAIGGRVANTARSM
ncbi:MAG: hypothetical protein GY931_11475, partial [Maribacter sp.]|nr:hypothetical protein [Maribacter sp.]